MVSLCEKYLESALESPMIQFLHSELVKENCKLPKIECSNNAANMNAIYKNNTITLFAPNIVTRKQLENIISHELVHAYDECRYKIDFDSCLMRACSEVRASMLSNECHYSQELLRGNFKFVNGFQDCVKRRAKMSLELSECKDLASDYVEFCFKTCFKNTEPFIDIP